MIKLRHCSALLVLSLFASTAFGGQESAGAPPKASDRPSRTSPGASCPLTCKVIRISTRCECPLGKSPINTTI